MYFQFAHYYSSYKCRNDFCQNKVDDFIKQNSLSIIFQFIFLELNSFIKQKMEQNYVAVATTAKL